MPVDVLRLEKSSSVPARDSAQLEAIQSRHLRCVPRATYRLQFNAGFTLRDAERLVPYLAELGVSHVYASPLLKASRGSMHGYDVCDFSQLNPELGTQADLESLVNALREHSMGLIVDIVPNHMGILDPGNRWWWDVLAQGQASPYARFFDIDWSPPDPRLRERVIMPVLGERYAQVLEKGELQLQECHGMPVIRYHDLMFPLTGDSVSALAVSPERPITSQELDRLLEHQHYRLTFWRQADTTLNYRRFFNIASLAALNVQDEIVFGEVHALVQQWVEDGIIDGLRIDHIDGLWDPEEYVQRLRRLAPKAWIVVEKILQNAESLPSSWPVDGTTGYDFLNLVGGLFVDPAGAERLADFCAEFTGQSGNFQTAMLNNKRLVLNQLLTPEVNRLASLLLQVSIRYWQYRDFTFDEFRQAVISFATALPVYRTYVQPASKSVSHSDAQVIERALVTAREQGIGVEPALLNFLGDLLTLKLEGPLEAEFVMRFQQFTGPVMAKGVEDTAFYSFNRLISLNDVGGNPEHFGLSIDNFHSQTSQARSDRPASMLATSTHDTKRGEDARVRLSLLSEIPEAWRSAVLRWSALAEPFRSPPWPDRNIEYHFYQTLVSAWPLEVERAQAYMEKAACEAKEYTTWTERNSDYDKALSGFIAGVLSNPDFVKAVKSFVAPLRELGWISSLAQTLLKLTAPGVPDCYQGSELWDLNLVDPDNRRQVDFGLRRRLLEETRRLPIGAIWERRADGLPKIWLIRQTLALRKRHPDWFDARGAYAPVRARGAKANHVVAYQRGESIVVVPRLVYGLIGEKKIASRPDFEEEFPINRPGWADTVLELPSGLWQNELTGETIAGTRVEMALLMARFPVALLFRKELG